MASPEDVLGWIAVLAVSIALKLFIDLPILDPILSILITLFVLFNVIKNIKAVMYVFPSRSTQKIFYRRN